MKKPRSYKIHLLVTKDEDERFSAIALNLPGAGSSGDTEEEAEKNARDAIRATIKSYLDDEAEIPWRDTQSNDIPSSAKLKLILVDV